LYSVDDFPKTDLVIMALFGQTFKNVVKRHDQLLGPIATYAAALKQHHKEAVGSCSVATALRGSSLG
jgi:hypothetical protein